jgi:hypothetical protein
MNEHIWIILSHPSRRFISSFFQSYSGQYLVEFGSLRVSRVVNSYHRSFNHFVEFASFSRIGVVDSFHHSFNHTLANILSSLRPFVSSESSIHIIALSIILWPTSCRACFTSLCVIRVVDPYHRSSIHPLVKFCQIYVPPRHPSRWFISSRFQSNSDQRLVAFTSLCIIRVVDSDDRSSIHTLSHVLSSSCPLCRLCHRFISLLL